MRPGRGGGHAGAALLDEKPSANDDEIKRALAGVLCRCGSYKKIIEAVKIAEQAMRVGR